MAKHNEIGQIGEKIASLWLQRRGFKILDKNYRKKWGEIDIVAQQGQILHFVEVKCVSKNVTNVNNISDEFRPEDNVHPQKLKRLYRTIETYLSEKDIESDWQLDVALVYLDTVGKRAKVKLLDNIVN